MKITVDMPITKEDTSKLNITIIYEELGELSELRGKESDLGGILNKVIEKRISLLKRKIKVSERERKGVKQ